jgi:hypothetical protein
LNSFKSGKLAMLIALRWGDSLFARNDNGMNVRVDEREKMMWESVCLRQVMGVSCGGSGKPL